MKINFKEYVQQYCTFSRKKIFLPIMALLMSLAAFSQSQQPCSAPSERKEIIISEYFLEVEVKGEITVILTSAPAGELMVEGNAIDVATVKTSVKKGRLIIEADKKRCNSKLTVFVSVTNVDTLIINRENEVFSFGKIKVMSFK